ncbi:TIGR03557 family F420-dependent LLM class oxidoreductase [Actinomadura logoneensis]|uniref:TIGR03557 family F420-dependent LLM class oxidoreductase n=1 Tax=Actinomadura logoneensis TaxID=2293572 RepID=A0A372JFH0_9ACTN|nr:TIGR03557 family F420-dependent LLM class oxidoreductase [Actinomadura logoneensis]RFU38594.1 TIGR03557 family F420-dependent LLM class oxidoreductase [Actinomadura logoneensis]
MTRFGYFLSSEEHPPNALVEQAVMAERAGFDCLWISDHYHPWLEAQGESGFVWAVIGAIAQACDLPVTTAVTCPTVRIHPAVLAQAAATAQILTGGRFRFGIGSGEALNEHILGDTWPSADVRLEMLEEAVEVIRELFTGRQVSHRGRHYTVETARLYSLPNTPPPLYISGFGPKAIDLAARIGDGFISIQPNKEHVTRFREKGGGTKPTQAGLKACWGPDEQEARKLVHRLWPNDALPGQAAQLLPLPAHFEELTSLIDVDDITHPCGPDPEVHVQAIKQYVDAGYDEIHISQVGPDQKGFFDFYEREVLPRVRAL